MKSIRQGSNLKSGQEQSLSVAANVVTDPNDNRSINITIHHPLAIPAIETESDSSEDLSPRIAEIRHLKTDQDATRSSFKKKKVKAKSNTQRISSLYKLRSMPDELAQLMGSVSTTRFMKDVMKTKKRTLGRQNIIINMIIPEFIGSPSLLGSKINFMDSLENR